MNKTDNTFYSGLLVYSYAFFDRVWRLPKFSIHIMAIHIVISVEITTPKVIKKAVTSKVTHSLGAMLKDIYLHARLKRRSNHSCKLASGKLVGFPYDQTTEAFKFPAANIPPPYSTLDLAQPEL